MVWSLGHSLGLEFLVFVLVLVLKIWYRPRGFGLVFHLWSDAVPITKQTMSKTLNRTP